MEAQVRLLKIAKARAVEAEAFEEAALLKRRIKVLESTLGMEVSLEAPSQPPASDVGACAAAAAGSGGMQDLEPPSTDLATQPAPSSSLAPPLSATMRVLPEERDFVTKSRIAMAARSVTDDRSNGVPTWAFRDTHKHGFAAVKTERPPDLQYVFQGQIEDEPMEEGAVFQTSVTIQVPLEVAFCRVLEEPAGHGVARRLVRLADGAFVGAGVHGAAELLQLDAADKEECAAAFLVTAAKIDIDGLEDHSTVSSDAFFKQPLYQYKSVWRLRLQPPSGTRVTRTVIDFKQFACAEVDALEAVSRAIELECESLRRSWSVALSVVRSDPPQVETLRLAPAAPCAALAKTAAVEGDLYSASFICAASPDVVFAELLSDELLYSCSAFLREGSVLRLSPSKVLLRRTDGAVVLLVIRKQPDRRRLLVSLVACLAGDDLSSAMEITSEDAVMAKPAYRIIEAWACAEHGSSQTVVHRSMQDFKQMRCFERSDLAVSLTEAADQENRLLAKYYRDRAARSGIVTKHAPAAISRRAACAMRKMPELLDMAAHNHVIEVREMLEVRGADPNYIHVREDTWTISNSALVFFEELTPLAVAAEHGACDVIKVLFDHPQIDVNLCCCAYNDLEVYSHYTAYDLAISRGHAHAAALMRARGVLPAASERVSKPIFDRVSGRPVRVAGGAAKASDFAMPSWEAISADSPALAQALREIADALSATKEQSLPSKMKLFKNLLTDWHPDRRQRGGEEVDFATKVFQWLQVVKAWYFDAGGGEVDDARPLPVGSAELYS